MASPLAKQKTSQPLQLSTGTVTGSKRAQAEVETPVPVLIDSKGYVNVDTVLEGFVPTDMVKWLPKVYIDLMIASQVCINTITLPNLGQGFQS